MSTLWPLLLLLATVAGFLRSRKTVRLYFRAQLIYIPVVFLGAKYLGDRAALYAVLYGAATLLILECCCFLIWEARLDLRLYIASLNFGLFMGIVTSIGAPRHPLGDYVTFGEGVMLSIIGMSLLQVANASEDKMAVKTIGILSLALSCYDFGFFRNESWYVVNGWLPSLLCSVAFLWIAAQPIRPGRSAPPSQQPG